MSSKPHGKANVHSNTNELPLLDEVNELIEKERLLLSLKLLEQKQEADEWKLKYDNLIGKVSQNVEKTGFEVLESAAESHQEDVIANISSSDITKIVSSQKLKWAIDLSGLKMDSVTFTNICKSLFATRSALSDQFTIASLRGCLVNDEFSAALCSVFRNSQILAVDISLNELSELFFLQLVTTLKDRRNSPQYILMDGNTPLSETVTHFPVILSTLTNSLWGFSTTLMDFADNVMSHQSVGQGGGGASPKKKGIARGVQQDYRESVKHPMKALEFLVSLNALMDSASSALASVEDKKKGKTSSAKVLSKQSKPHGRLNGLQSLCTLGLTFSHLSKKSIATLESTLTLTAATLVDLDLSFAYVGFVGAEMLRRVLSSADCQIARLSLQGNAIGDQGLSALCRSFQANKTLTYLDVRSNAVSDSGLRGVERALCRCAVLYLIDLRNNSSISDGAVISLCGALRNSSSQLQLRFSGISSTDLGSSSSENNFLKNTLFYAQSQKIKHTAALDRSCLLYSIDLSALATQRRDSNQTPVSLKWRWRPVQTAETINIMQKVQSASKVAANSSRGPGSKSRLAGRKGVGGTGDDAYQSLSRYTVCFDLRLPAPADNLRPHAISSGSSVTRRLFSTGGDEFCAEWSLCSAVLTAGELPPKGALELHMVLLDRDGTVVANPGGACVVVECMDLTVQGMQTEESCSLSTGSGGAQSVMSTITQKSALSLALQTQLLKAGRGDVVHCHMWTSAVDEELSVEFDLKLTASGGQDDSDANAKSAGDERPPQHETLGYEWFVNAFSVSGASAVVARGLCSSASSEGQSEGAPSPQSLLHAWTWRSCRTTLAGSALHSDDLLVVTARALSTQLKYPPALLKKCSVTFKNLTITSLTPTSKQSAAVLSAVAGEGFEWASFAQHSSQTSCQFPM